MGGEWASGATLVSETWSAEHRGKALALMQSAWAIGYALAAAVNFVVQPAFGWRAVFFVGILPAFPTRRGTKARKKAGSAHAATGRAGRRWR